MTTDLLDRAQAGDADAFARLVGPYRRELQVHCYRLLGSAADAEDALQETLVSAWQGLPAFEGRASIRTSVPGSHQPVPGRAAVGPPAPGAGHPATGRADAAGTHPARRGAVARALPRWPAHRHRRQRAWPGNQV